MQATHFVDLMRYIGGEIVPDSVVGTAVGPEFPLSELAALAPEAEFQVGSHSVRGFRLKHPMQAGKDRRQQNAPGFTPRLCAADAAVFPLYCAVEHCQRAS